MSLVKLIRRLKIAYAVYNVFHPSKLKHNKLLYKKTGLSKFYFSPISSKDFTSLQRENLTQNNQSIPLETTKLYQKIDNQSKQSLQNFEEFGYAVLQNYLTDEEINTVNNEIDSLLKNKKVKFRYGNKIMFAFKKSKVLKKIGENVELTELLNSLTRDDMKLFQSINFLTGSQQRTHSDSIHMTTFPLGGLLGVWIALEDIDLDNGPLHYYPTSHKLPYYLNSDYDNEGNSLFIGNKDYSSYEDMISAKIEEFKIEKKVFTAKKG